MVPVKPALKSDTKHKAGILSSASDTNFLLSWGRGYGHELSLSQYKKYIFVDDSSFFPPHAHVRWLGLCTSELSPYV